MKKLILLSLLLLCVPLLYAQEISDEKLFNMSLEELMNIRIKQTTLIDVPHTHAKGEWMFSYQYMFMNMSGHRNGRLSLSNEEVLEHYMISPIHMQMDMHMIHLMYAPSRRLTLMSMLNYSKNSMEHVNKVGDTFSANTQGLNDIKISALYTLLERRKNRLVGTVGLSIPTGSINEKAAGHGAVDDHGHGHMPTERQMERLPYPMQLGTGTWDPTLAATYYTVTSGYGWGGDLRNTFRLHKNQNAYDWGNLFKLTSWYSKIWKETFTTTIRLECEERGNIGGADPELNPMMAYTADPSLRGGTLVQAGLGFSYRPNGALKGSRIAFEGKTPFYQNLKGPQLATQNSFKVALVYVLATH